MRFIRHVVNDMDSSMVQKCIACGKVISDYRNAMWPSGQQAPKGFPAGEVYVSSGGNPTIYSATLEQGQVSLNCTPVN